MDRELERRRELAKRAATLLREREMGTWVDEGRWYGCVTCRALYDDHIKARHAPDCELAAVIRELEEVAGG